MNSVGGFVYIADDWQCARFYFDKVPAKQRNGALPVTAARVHVHCKSLLDSVCAVVQRSSSDSTKRRVCGVFRSEAAAMRFVRQSDLPLPSQRDAHHQWHTSVVRCTNVLHSRRSSATQCAKKRKQPGPVTFWCQRDLDRRFNDHYCTENGQDYFACKRLADGRVVRMSPHYTLQYN